MARGVHIRHDGGGRVIALSLLTNVFVAAAKALGAVVTGSGALLAGAVHTGADGGAQSVLLASRRRERRASWSDIAQHPVARHRERLFWAFGLGALLAGAGSVAVVYNAVGRLAHPADLVDPGLAVSISVATVLWKAVSTIKSAMALRPEVRPEPTASPTGLEPMVSSDVRADLELVVANSGEAGPYKGSDGTTRSDPTVDPGAVPGSAIATDSNVATKPDVTIGLGNGLDAAIGPDDALGPRQNSTPAAAWWRRLRHPKHPELAMVALQDAISTASGIGVAAAVTAATLTDDPMFDTIGMLVVGALMAATAISHLVLMKSTVVGHSAGGAGRQRIAAAIEIEPSVVRLAHLETHYLGPDELLVAAKVDLIEGLDLADVAETVERLEASIRRAVPTTQVLYLEPDVCRTRATAYS